MLPCKAVPDRNFIKMTSVVKAEKFNKDGSPCRTHTNRIKGQSGEVYAFRSKSEIQAMLRVFDKHISEALTVEQRRIACRNKLLFVVGINVGLRASDLRKLQWKDFFKVINGTLTCLDFKKFMPEKTKKKSKYVPVYYNAAIWQAVAWYLQQYPMENLDEYLFLSRKGRDPISVASLWNIIKDTAAEAGIKQNIGSHSLRKTFGYWAYHTAADKSAALVQLQKTFNHSTTLVTMCYIGIMDEEIKENFMNVNLGIE